VVFWLPARRTGRQMLWYAGFEQAREVSRFAMRSSQGWRIRHVVHHAQR
jgi:hypothetical protein